MRRLVLGLILFAASGAARATPPDAPVLLYGVPGQGRVVFDGRLHASKGLACNDCHAAAIFATKKQALMSMDDHGSARACWACHDGRRAFDACTGCHRQ
jgi:phosphate transport system substrate-binding protein